MSKEDRLSEKIRESFDCGNCKYECHCRFGAGYDLSEDCDCDADVYAEGFESGWDEALKSQWIKVDDKLPDDLEKVLLASLYEGEILYSVGYIFNGKWVTSNNKPFAWMPIPSFDKILEDNKDVLKRLKDK